MTKGKTLSLLEKILLQETANARYQLPKSCQIYLIFVLLMSIKELLTWRGPFYTGAFVVSRRPKIDCVAIIISANGLC